MFNRLMLPTNKSYGPSFFEIQPTVYFKGSRVCLFPKIEIPQDEQRHLLVRRAGRGRNNFAEGLPVLQKKNRKIHGFGIMEAFIDE